MAPRRDLDKAGLEAAALAYLERYATSAENLRRVLLRKVRRAQPEEDLTPIVDAIVERYVSARLVDDHTFAAQRAASLARRGDSKRQIVEKLRIKGVSVEDAKVAMAELADGDPAALELGSAWSYARRRRLGPYRLDPDKRATNVERDLAALCRRGFSYSVAKAVIRAELDDAPKSG